MSKRLALPGGLEHIREFVNTLDVERGAERLFSEIALSEWLTARNLAPPEVHASGTDLLNAIELREALRAILLAHNGESVAPADAWRALDGAAGRARLRLQFRADGSTAMEPEAAGVDGALGRLLAIVAEAIADGTWGRLKACREHSCEWAFYDRTKNRSGAWCDMQVCGNRAKARAYRVRRAGTAAPD